MLSRLEEDNQQHAVIESLRLDLVHHYQDPAFNLNNALQGIGVAPSYVRRLWKDTYGCSPKPGSPTFALTRPSDCFTTPMTASCP